MFGAATAVRRTTGLCAAAAGVLALGAATAVAATPFVYVVDDGASVSQFASAPNGTLARLAPAPAATGLGPAGIAMAPDGRSAYVANVEVDTVSQYDVAPDGSLSAKGPSTTPTGDRPLAVAISPDGESAYVTDSDAATVSQYDVDDDGELSAKATATVPTGSGPWGVAVSPDGRSAYVASSTDGRVSIYDVATDGALSAASTPSIAVPGAIQLAVSPNGRNLYVTTQAGTLLPFDRAADGSLTAMAPAAGAPETITSLALTPDGRHLYTARPSSSSIARYAIGTGGALTFQDAFVPSGSPRGLAVSPDGDSLYASDTLAGRVLQLDVQPDGQLRSKSPATVVASTPEAIALTPQADLALELTASPEPVGTGAEVTYAITATNAEGVPATGVTVTDSLPSDLVLISATSSRGPCDETGTVTCALGVLEQGATATVTIRARAVRSGTVTNTATVDALQQDPDRSNDEATSATTVDDRPGVTTAPASDVAPTAATLNGVVDAGGTTTTYRFDYGATAAYGLATPDGDAGSGTRGRAVSATIDGLAPSTTYHYRIVATNSDGRTAEGGEQTFTTPAAPTAAAPGGGAGAGTGGGSDAGPTGGEDEPNDAPPVVPPLAADRTAPRLSRVTLTATSLRAGLSEGASVRATIQRRTVRRVRQGKRVRRVVAWRTIRRVRASSSRAGTISVRLRGRPLEPGRYRVTVRATDAAGDAGKRVVATKAIR